MKTRRKSVLGRWVGIGVSEQCVQRPCGRKQLRGPLELMVGVMSDMRSGGKLTLSPCLGALEK